MATRKIAILMSAMIMATCAFAHAQSGPLDSDPINDGTARLESQWKIHIIAPSEATSGSADPGPALRHNRLAADALNGHGPGCTSLSPCAAVSPARSGPLPGSKPSRFVRPRMHRRDQDNRHELPAL